MSSAEKRIHQPQQTFAAAEILGERNRCAAVPAPVPGVGAENFRVGQPETVDALFDVAHQEAIGGGALAAKPWMILSCAALMS